MSLRFRKMLAIWGVFLLTAIKFYMAVFQVWLLQIQVGSQCNYSGTGSKDLIRSRSRKSSLYHESSLRSRSRSMSRHSSSKPRKRNLHHELSSRSRSRSRSGPGPGLAVSCSSGPDQDLRPALVACLPDPGRATRTTRRLWGLGQGPYLAIPLLKPGRGTLTMSCPPGPGPGLAVSCSSGPDQDLGPALVAFLPYPGRATRTTSRLWGLGQGLLWCEAHSHLGPVVISQAQRKLRKPSQWMKEVSTDIYIISMRTQNTRFLLDYLTTL